MQVSSAAPQTQRPVNRDQIAAAERLIRPYVRHTPIIMVDAHDLGLDAAPLVMKLEFLQHTGSFKPRGAFANLLTRPAPAVGVAAASGGNHGAAVAYAAKRLGIRATIFVPRITSPAKIKRIRNYGAELVVAGNRYADALAASEDFIARTGALAVHAYDQPETILGQGTVGLEIESDSPNIDTLLRRSWRGRADRRHCRLVCRANPHRGGRAGTGADLTRCSRRRSPDRCAGRRHRRRLAGAASGRRIDAPHRTAFCRALRAGLGRCRP